MRIGITGEKGFIATNLAKEINNSNNTFLSIDNSDFAMDHMIYTESNEVCVHQNSVEKWIELFKSLSLDVIVHNAAIVGTDVVALNPEDAILTNILGTQKITEAANLAGILNVYIGTTVIYDTNLYQVHSIVEESIVRPKTSYAVQKYAGEMIVRSTSNNFLVMRPLFAYGGEGDMNSLIAKSLYGIKNNIENIDMFLDVEKVKDYMHVSDFCRSIIIAINSNVRNKDFNVSAQNPHTTLEIINMIEDITGKDLSSTIKWHPNTDYLGNHRLSNEKFVKHFGDIGFLDLKAGIRMSWHSINSSKNNYNPLKHLNEAKEKDIDLKDFFPKN